MGDAQQIWSSEGAVHEHGQAEVQPQLQARGATKSEANRQQPQPPQHQVGTPLAHVAQLQALTGHANISAADISALHHNALLLQAQQAQQDYESEQREKGAMQMAPPEAMGMQMGGQPGVDGPPQLQHQHDADYERERKEKRKVANREAARRMRQRRADQVNSLSLSNADMKAENAALQQQLAHLANHNRELMTENASLRQEVLALKQTVENNRAGGLVAGN